MGEIHCYHCDTSIEGQLDAEWMECPFCKQPLDIAMARRWGAAGRMLAALRDPDLDPDLRLQLGRMVQEHHLECKRSGFESNERGAQRQPPRAAFAEASGEERGD